MVNRELLEQKLSDIHLIIKENYQSENDIGVLGGLSGLALFEFYYSKHLDIEEPSDIGVEIISRGISKINNGYGLATFCSGIAGFGWVLDHLNNKEFIELDNDTLLEPLDSYLSDFMLSELNNGNYDFLHGSLGCGLYFLKRFKSTHNNELRTKYHEKLIRLIELLKDSSENENSMTKWKSILDNEKGNEGYNLSLSHGISSVINFITRLSLEAEFKPMVEPILKQAIAYVLSFKMNAPENLSLFPSWITDSEPIEYQSRISWCYGDLGIGITLLQASKAIESDNLKKDAIEILKHAAKRRTMETTRIIDAGLCHGSYGNAQIFNRIYQETKISNFQETALYWIQDGLNKAVHEDGYAGYKQWGGLEQVWKSELSLLEGVAGIGLSIIDFLSTDENSWDECLLLS
ncbi:hypothetical protein FEE95_06820 [Maribacter algarum]|uniref:Lanthionine synthetase C-like protein n=1 Tax=Maribacter algarum (ex Zhang et al. 2020) TaxID=2578118 RepID=A0A5S3PW68_9FLAO|nr:lanthionine synthetase C family protein [Maribacter algarum]TMM59138.1 hypothetical protein FEE95_06820 [Maribacter algarum]